MLKVVLFLTMAWLAVVRSNKVQCRQNSECGQDECCYYHEGPMIASKRLVQLGSAFTGFVQGGWCEKYQLQGQSCSPIATMNGHCGCATGLTCKFIADPTLQVLIPPVKRSMILGGHHECQP